MAASSMAHRRASGVVVGVDTHKDLHVARAKDELGRGLGEMTIPASAKGYRALLSWSRGLGEVEAFGSPALKGRCADHNGGLSLPRLESRWHGRAVKGLSASHSGMALRSSRGGPAIVPRRPPVSQAAQRRRHEPAGQGWVNRIIAPHSPLRRFLGSSSCGSWNAYLVRYSIDSDVARVPFFEWPQEAADL
jgi:hypothetical protein